AAQQAQGKNRFAAHARRGFGLIKVGVPIQLRSVAIMLLSHGIERGLQSYPGIVRRLRGEKVVRRVVLVQSVRMCVEEGAQSFWSASAQLANGALGSSLVFRYGVARELIEHGHELASAF